MFEMRQQDTFCLNNFWIKVSNSLSLVIFCPFGNQGIFEIITKFLETV